MEYWIKFTLLIMRLQLDRDGLMDIYKREISLAMSQIH
jgi:hypothetical protein